jgi:hypothetical protein
MRDAEQLTCMRAKYLTALEEERFEELPGRTYARAFLRSYAAALGLQADRFVAEFDLQQPEPEEEETAPPEFRPRQPIRRLPPSIPALAVAALAALFVWSAWTSDQDLNPPVGPTPVTRAAVQAGNRVAATHTSPAAAVVVRAVGGPCWIEAHRGSRGGPLLARRTLAQGATETLAAPRVWLRLGAPWNVVARRGAHVVRRLARTGPSNLTL